MFRSSVILVHNLFRNSAKIRSVAQPIAYGVTRFMSKHNTETDEQFDQRYERFFNDPNIDGWDIRSGVTELWGHDLVPEPKIFIAVLEACRRVNDLALTIRVLEALKDKCGNKSNEIYPWYMEQIKPTLIKLGIPTIEELGFDKPELALKCVFDM